MKYPIATISKSFILLSISVLLTFFLNRRIANLPPVGKFLDPFHGFWRNAESRNIDAGKVIKIKGVKDRITIVFDDMSIPHITANNNDDLYFAQGFITAKYRLWQMDFQSHYAAGRLAEIFGPQAANVDRYQRRIGMVYGAENMMKVLNKDAEIKQSIDAYRDGVNAYIGSLNRNDIPLEFKMLDYLPEKWESINTALLLKLMTQTLAGGSDEYYMTNVLNKYGPDVTRELFPDHQFKSEPTIPKGHKWAFKPISISPGDKLKDLGNSARLGGKEIVEGIGSNNWAISGSKTLSGYPLLANDPHLSLTLPSIWFEIQLMSKDLNVCGVSIPGAPGVIIGFNKKISWGITNVGADVLDLYKIKFKDESKKYYWYHNEWLETKQRIETIKIRGGGDIKDTVYYVAQGPIVYLDERKKHGDGTKPDYIPEGYAMRWVAHDPSNEIRAFYLLNRAQGYNDYEAALRYFSAPAQNFVFASIDNDIAVNVSGFFPLKWKEQGKFLLDGSNPADDWQGQIPYDQIPRSLNPESKFVSSANQVPADENYPYYINWEFAGYERAHRINSRLSGMTKANVDSLRNLQNDNYSVLAEDILPTLVKSINRQDLNNREIEYLDVVSKWNKYFDYNSVGASIFDFWESSLEKKIWGNKFDGMASPMKYPSRDRTVDLILNQPDSHWFDDIKTPNKKETKNDIILYAFKSSVDSLHKMYGDVKNWQWGKIKKTQISHLMNLPGLGSSVLNLGGSKTSVNAQTGKNGPSWRMIVSMEKSIKAYGILPGGESGNPGSYYYDNMIDNWAAGKLAPLLFLNSANEQSERILSKWILTSSKN